MDIGEQLKLKKFFPSWLYVLILTETPWIKECFVVTLDFLTAVEAQMNKTWPKIAYMQE